MNSVKYLGHIIGSDSKDDTDIMHVLSVVCPW